MKSVATPESAVPEVDGVYAEGLLQLVFILDPAGFQMGISGLRPL